MDLKLRTCGLVFLSAFHCTEKEIGPERGEDLLKVT